MSEENIDPVPAEDEAPAEEVAADVEVAPVFTPSQEPILDLKNTSRHTIQSAKEESKPEVKISEPEIPTFEIRRSATEIRRSEHKFSTQDVAQQRSKQSVGSVSKEDTRGQRKSTRSIGKAVGSLVSFRRGSIAEYFDRQKTAKFMNTYKLESDKPFNVDRVTKILEEVLVEALDNLTYDPDKVPKQAKWASSAIRAKVKEQEFDRYKIICVVTIGEKRSQDMFSTYRFLWDMDRDKHASFVHENMYVFAIAVCFGLYYE